MGSKDFLNQRFSGGVSDGTLSEMVGRESQYRSEYRSQVIESVGVKCDSITQQSYGAGLCRTPSSLVQPQSFDL